MHGYARILRSPHMAALLGSSLLARLPIGINGLAAVLFLRERTGSFAVAGAAAGALALGTALGAPAAARLVDRWGARSLLLLGAVHAGGLAALIAAGYADAPAAALVGVALVTGVALPPTSSVMRALYPRLLHDDPDLVRGAYALDSVLTETIFLVGPLLTALLVATLAPAAALGLSAVAVAVGTVAFVLVLPAADEPEHATAATGRLGALRAPGIQTLVLSMVPVGFGFGALEVAIPAFASERGRPELAGVLIAIWAVGSIAGGLVYGARASGLTLAQVHVRVAVLLPIGFLALAAAESSLAMALLVIPAGVFIAPLIATRNELAGVVALPGSRTEAFTWPLTALVGGVALGAAAAGGIVEASGWRTAVLVAAASAALGACISVTRRGTLRAAPLPSSS
jgi:MFS family permease